MLGICSQVTVGQALHSRMSSSQNMLFGTTLRFFGSRDVPAIRRMLSRHTYLDKKNPYIRILHLIRCLAPYSGRRAFYGGNFYDS